MGAVGFDVDGTVAITGAGQGIGLGIVRAFARRGCNVLALVLEEAHRDAVAEATSGLPGSVRTEILDVTDPGDFRFPADLQVLVNNAGIRLAFLPIEETPEQDWRRTFDVNFFGTVEMTRRAIPVLRASGRGVICTLSTSALLWNTPFLSAYRPSKAALSAFCEALRVEMAPFGIRVVEILPGATVSAINADSILRRVADAVEYPAYRRMAELQFSMNRSSPEAQSADETGEAIALAIYDEDGPMRYGTDDQSNSMLAAWRTTPDEERFAQAIAGFRELLPE
jgi:NAD(P)-dependent dehydrogenase (short-subunit alcohol dehydrogenase family)